MGNKSKKLFKRVLELLLQLLDISNKEQKQFQEEKKY